MDDMDKDFMPGWVELVLMDEINEETRAETKRRIRAMDEQEAKECLYWAIQALKDYRKLEDSHKQLVNAIRIVRQYG